MLSCIEHYAYPLKVLGGIMEVPLTSVSLGEICLIKATTRSSEWRRGEVVGFKPDGAIIGLYDNGHDLSPKSRVYPTGHPLNIFVSGSSLGAVYNGSGQICGRISPSLAAHFLPEWRSIASRPPDPLSRKPLITPYYTGVRAVDALITCSKGQRVGIFSAAGGGKSTLLSSLLYGNSADVIILALIGERGREVNDFIHHNLKHKHRSKTVVVYATSDAPPIERKNAALIAMTLAEYFRDAGCGVLLLMDSVTRYARALREVSFAAGEQAVSGGFPASVFADLPRLLERAGPGSGDGAITAFFTILLESQHGHDAVGEEARSILDGHIYLSPALAAANHYPAIDVLKSLSRLFSRVTTLEHQNMAAVMRRALQRLDEISLLLELGEYKPGQDDFTDRVILNKPLLMTFLQQFPAESEGLEGIMEKMSIVTNAFL